MNQTSPAPNAAPKAIVLDRRARAAVSGAFAVQGLCFAGILTKVSALQDRFGLSEAELTLILLAVPLVAGLGSVLAGHLAPRAGSAVLLRVAGIGVCLSVAGIGFSHVLVALCIAVCAFGLFVGGVDATMNMQGVAVQRRYGRSVLASFHGWWSLAGIAGSLVNAGIAGLGLPLDVALGIIATVGLGIALVAGPYLVGPAAEGAGPTVKVAATAQAAADPDVAPEPVRANTAVAIRWGTVTLIGLAVMIMYIGESSVSTWATVFLRDVLRASEAVVPLGLAAYLTLQLLGRALADRAVRRFGTSAIMAVGGVVGLVGFAMIVAAVSAPMAIVGFGVVGAGLCVVVPLAFSAAGALDTGGGAAIARVNLFNYLGFVVGTALIGAISGSLDLRWAFAVPGLLVFGIIALAPVFRLAGAGLARTA